MPNSSGWSKSARRGYLRTRVALLLLGGLISATAAEIEITPITHASVQLAYDGKVIQVDPVQDAQKADLILITGPEADHLDPATIARLRKPGAPVVIPQAGKDKVPDGVVLANGESKEVAGIRVDAVAAYDLIPGDPFHPKGRGNGYVITLGGKRIFFSGVGECVPEVQALKNIDIAFVSMNLPHGRMTMEAAAACMETFHPAIVYPYHYRTGKVEDFKRLLDGKGIEVRLANWYPASPK
jgi:L-ascorbate metabolism protein UlaG (beta-lactamase superfamily)